MSLGIGMQARRVLDTLAGIGRTYWEWALLALQAERDRLMRLWLLATVALYCGFVGTALAAAALLLACEPASRPWVAGGLAGLFLLAGAVACWHWRACAQRGVQRVGRITR